jgi:Sulfatase-modifying factor enzyme 1
MVTLTLCSRHSRLTLMISLIESHQEDFGCRVLPNIPDIWKQRRRSLEVVDAILRITRLNQRRSAHFRSTPNNVPRAVHLLAAVLGSLLIISSAFAGELRIANPLAEEQARRGLEKASKEEPWQNSLGMKFVPVSGTKVLFGIWDTRVEDFRVFVESTGYDATGGMWSLEEYGWKQLGATWKEPGFSQGPTDPVVGLSWDDATAFCLWLTERERGSGVLPEGMRYRLPTDQEWSIAAGLDSEPGDTPEEKDSKIKGRAGDGVVLLHDRPRGHILLIARVYSS